MARASACMAVSLAESWQISSHAGRFLAVGVLIMQSRSSCSYSLPARFRMVIASSFRFSFQSSRAASKTCRSSVSPKCDGFALWKIRPAL